MKRKKEGNLHYAWYILIVCFLLNMIVQAFVMSVSNLYVVPIWKEFQVSRSLVTMQSICVMISAVLSAPIWGRLYRNGSARTLLPGALTGTAFCCFIRSVCPNIYCVLICAFLKGIFFTGSTLLPISILLTEWFAKKRGFAISVAAIGSSVGGVILSPFVNYLIVELGWRHADQIMGILIFFICVPLTYFVIRNKPSDVGICAFGKKDEQSESLKEEVSGRSHKKIQMDYKIFVLFLIGIFCMTFANGAALQLPTFLMDIHYSSSKAAATVSGYMLVGIGGKLLLGWIVDHFGIKKAVVYNCIVGALSFICFIFAGNEKMIIGIILFFGLTSGITSMLPTLLTSAIFEEQNYASVYGIVVSVNRLGGGIGTLMVAILFDITGKYSVIWPLCFFMMLFTMFCILICFELKLKKSRQ